MANPFRIPLNALRAIEIVARRGSLGPAAEELGVTPGAVSQHIRRAEERLGVELFERTPQGLVPRDSLRRALPQLSSGFTLLADGIGGLSAREDHVLTVTVASVFASRFLVWRIGKFTQKHPELDVRLSVSPVMVDLAHSDVDCAIRYGTGRWDGVRAERLGGEIYRPVCAPPVAAKLQRPADIAAVPVIRDKGSMLSWDAWFAAAGMTTPGVLSGPLYTDASIAFDAAIAEQGVLLAVDMMTADAVSDGRLVRPFETSVTGEFAYWFGTASERRVPKKVALFRDWLIAEVADSGDGYVGQRRRAVGGTPEQP